jgi:hypothetical protein
MADTFVGSNYPYWPGPREGFQNPFLIPGHILAVEMKDIPVSKVKSNANNSDIRVIPMLKVPIKVSDAAILQGYNPILGRGAGPGLFDLFYVSEAVRKNTAQVKK